MHVKLELFSYFRTNCGGRDSLELPAGATVADLLTRLAIDRAEVGILVINGKPGKIKDRLAPGDRVTLIPIIGGG